MRESQAAVVLIREQHDAGWRYLCHWSDSWNALHFVGGHREPSETFRECAVREAQEELGIGPAEIVVEEQPLGRLEYVTFSVSAGVQTFYVIEVFYAAVDATLCHQITLFRPRNHWVSREEIRNGFTLKGLKVSITTDIILTKLLL